MRKWLNFAAAMICVISSASAANAATSIVINGKLTGATGVNVNGTIYDVEFLDGTCVNLFNGCNSISDFTFNEEGALQAASALLNQVFINTPEGQFDTNPALTFGCDESDICDVRIPSYFSLSNPELVIGASALNTSSEADQFALSAARRNFDSSDASSIVFARFQQISAVPEPSTWAMLLFGFGFVGVIMRSAKRGKKLAIFGV